MQTIDISQSQEIFTVTQLNREVRFILESSFPLLWVEGEISNFSAPNSGHWYFCLKDTNAQVRCAMFRMSNRRLNFSPKDGMHVLVKAKVGLYEGRGEFQLLIEHMEEVGEGKLRKEFEALKNRLQADGLFDEKYKKALPLMPRNIGVITSATGAAIRDILSVLKRRFPCGNVLIYPTLVQGEIAAPNIVKAIELANRRSECDVLILARGGGSLEDLWPFNEEIVAHAIFKSELPIVSGVGHEVDFTIADFVADMRAPTPSAAAELITPHFEELLQALRAQQARFIRQLTQKLQYQKQNLSWLDKHLQQQHPKKKLAEQQQKLDSAEALLVRLQEKLIRERHNKLTHLQARLHQHLPSHQIKALDQHLQHCGHKLYSLLKQNNFAPNHKLIANLAGKLEALSPLSTLSRGYALVSKDAKILRNNQDVNVGDKINIRLATGGINCTVDECT